jgi:hypothetical protein
MFTTRSGADVAHWLASVVRGMLQLLLLVVLACTPHGDPSAFHVFFPDARTGDPAAFHIRQGARVQLKPSAECRYGDGKAARWAITGARLADGKLPPGLVLEDGAIAGAAKATGIWQASVAFSGVTCAGRAQPDVRIAIAITVDEGR